MKNHKHSDNELMPLSEFLQETGMSQSTERRLRQEQEDWPPHLSLGKRIYYLRSGWAQWLVGQAKAIRARRGSVADPDQPCLTSADQLPSVSQAKDI